MSRKAPPGSIDLPEDVALSVERLSRTDTNIHEARYRPAVSVFAHLRERQAADRGPQDVVYELGADDEEEDDDEAAGPPVGEISSLADVSFDVRRGEALGIVGTPYSAVRTLTRALCGMTAPSSGRIVMRGRVGPSVELAIALTSSETSVSAVARRLAGLAGPGRRLHNAYVREALELAFADEPHAASMARPPKNFLRRAAVAATLDPFAETLVIDALPEFGDPEFPERCIQRIRDRLDAGAAAVVACEDFAVIRALCSRVVWLEDERVRRIGPLDDVLAELSGRGAPAPEEEAVTTTPAQATAQAEKQAEARKQARALARKQAKAQAREETKTQAVPKPRRPKLPLRWFDAHAALLSVQVADAAAGSRDVFGLAEEIWIRVAFETVTPGTVRVVIRIISEETRTFLDDFPLEPGEHVAQLRLPAGIEAAGDYDVAAWLIFEHEDGRTKIGRAPAARVRVAEDESLLSLEREGAGRAATVATDDEVEWAIESAPPVAAEPVAAEPLGT